MCSPLLQDWWIHNWELRQRQVFIAILNGMKDLMLNPTIHLPCKIKPARSNQTWIELVL
jgi:hypothetical protein